MNAQEFKDRLRSASHQIDSMFDREDVAPIMNAAEKGLVAIEKIIGYCNDKLTPTPLEDRASPERMQSRLDRAKARGKELPVKD